MANTCNHGGHRTPGPGKRRGRVPSLVRKRTIAIRPTSPEYAAIMAWLPHDLVKRAQFLAQLAEYVRRGNDEFLKRLDE